MKVLREIHLFPSIVLLYFSLPNVSSLNECPDSDNVNTIVESINDQLQLDRFFQNVISYDSQTQMCIQLSLTGNEFTLDIVQLMRINATKLIVMGDGTIDINCAANVTDLNTLRNIVQPILRASLVLFDGLAFNKCPVPILIEEVAVVMILNCVFINHEHGAVNILNSPKVIVKNCTFLNNTSSSFFTRKPFQGNAGGLSIGHNIKLATLSLSTVDILVTDCNFTYNHAAPPSHLLASLNGALARGTFSGRGGGLSIPVNITGEFNCTVNNSVFVNNFADVLGGGAYIFISVITLNQTYMFGNNIFRMNSADFGGGLCFVSYVLALTNFFQSTILYNCTFANNFANSIGGGIFLLPSFRGLGGTSVRFERCGFHSNLAVHHGGAAEVISSNRYGNRQNQIPVEFVHCVFDDNFGADGAAVSLYYRSARLDNVTFSNQRGTAVRVVGTTIKFSGPATFIHNNAEAVNGGAIILISFSQIFLYHGANIDFIGNTGKTGASIIRNAKSIVPLVFEKTFYNPLCFIQFENPTIPPTEIKQVSTNFTANRAIIGSAVYTNNLALCSWYSNNSPFFSNEANVIRWESLFYSNDNVDTGHMNSTDQTLAVQTPAVDFILMNQTVSAYPGELIKLTMLSFDEQNYTTSDTIQIFGAIHAKNFSFDFSPKAATMEPSKPSFIVKYGIKSTDLQPSEIIMNSTYKISVSAFRENFPQIRNFNLTIAPCPPGHVLHSTDEGDEYQCQCDNDNDQNIVKCASNENKTILKAGQWATYVDTGLIHGMLEYYYCPPGYCQCNRVDGSSSICNNVYYYDDDDRQCVCDRRGYLCGKCNGDKGVSALLNKCVSCGKASILLVISLAILDIIVITSILVCSASIKPWLYSFLFYLQVTPYLAQYFPVTFAAVHPYLYYISSATSLYFPFDFCLYPGMTALVSYTLRYLPLLLGVMISLILYVANKHFKLGKNLLLSWSGLWVLTILLSTDVLNTSLSILNCPSLSDKDGSKTLRWFVDGTVECYVGSHLALALVAIMILIFYILLTIFVLAVVMKKIKRHWAFSMADILYEPYTDKYKWWAPVELVRRSVFIIAIIAVPGNLTVALLPMIILVSILIYLKPYKKMHSNILESVVSIDILILLMIASVSTDEIFTDNSSKTSPIDECGNIDQISDHAALLIPFYYAPLVLLLVVATAKLLIKLKKMYTERNKLQQDYHTQSGDEAVELICESVAAHYWEF